MATKDQIEKEGGSCELVATDFWHCRDNDGRVWWCSAGGKQCIEKPLRSHEMGHSYLSKTKIEILRQAVARLEEELGDTPSHNPAVSGVHVGVDPLFVEIIAEANPKILFKDNASTDPIKEYVECLKSLCDTTGGTWIDDDPSKPAGCHFPGKLQAAAYAISAWTCLPQALLKTVFA